MLDHHENSSSTWQLSMHLVQLARKSFEVRPQDSKHHPTWNIMVLTLFFCYCSDLHYTSCQIHPTTSNESYWISFYKIIVTSLFWAVLGLRCWAGFSLVVEGLLSGCGARAFHCGASLAAELELRHMGFSNHSSRDLEWWLSNCGTLN